MPQIFRVPKTRTHKHTHDRQTDIGRMVDLQQESILFTTEDILSHTVNHTLRQKNVIDVGLASVKKKYQILWND